MLSLRNGKLHARNYVGIIETKRNTVVEVLPKVDFATDDADTRDVFLKMLRTYRGLRFAEFNQTSIDALRRFDMLSVFVRLFLDDLVRLTQRGLARHYEPVEDNLYCLRGRIQFPLHIRLNAANRTRFYVGFDEFTTNRPVNRLIHTTIHRLRATAHPDHRQLLHQLRICFADVPLSERPDVDWRRHRIDRSMRHYDTVMAWVGLFLFNHGLATFAGEHVNRALLFPMEEVFEDFVVDAFRRYQGQYRRTCARAAAAVRENRCRGCLYDEAGHHLDARQQRAFHSGCEVEEDRRYGQRSEAQCRSSRCPISSTATAGSSAAAA